VPRGDGGRAGALWQSCAQRGEEMSGFGAWRVSLRGPEMRHRRACASLPVGTTKISVVPLSRDDASDSSTATQQAVEIRHRMLTTDTSISGRRGVRAKPFPASENRKLPPSDASGRTWARGVGATVRSCRPKEESVEQRTRRWTRIARLSLVALGGFVMVLAISGLASVYAPNVPYFSALPISGPAPLVVQFSASPALAYEWDFTNDGTVDAAEQNPTHTYNVVGWHTVRLVLTLNVQGTMYRLTQIRQNYIWVMPSGGGSQQGPSQSQGWPWPWPWPSGQQNQPSQQQNPPAQPSVSLTIYWGNIGDNTIRRAHSTGGMYGKSVEMVKGAPYVDKPTGIQYSEGWVAWANYGNDTIYAKEVGSGNLPVKIADKDDGVNQPSGLCIVNGKRLYWANQGDGRVYVITINSKNAAFLVRDTGHYTEWLNTKKPYGIQVADGYLYWASAGDNNICRARLVDFKTVGATEVVAGPVVSGVDQPGAIRVVGGYLYWANGRDNTIRRCSLNGPFPAKSEKLAGPEVSKVNIPTGIAVLGNMIGWANYSNNTFHACTIGSSPCQSTLMGTNQSSQIDGPSFIWVEAGS
jgi:PKD repeat protein